MTPTIWVAVIIKQEHETWQVILLNLALRICQSGAAVTLWISLLRKRLRL